MIKVAIFDFDGTVVTKDILDGLCGLNNKKEESELLNRQFHEGKISGAAGLVKRINFLNGITLDEIYDYVMSDLSLMPGAREVFDYCNEKNIVTILASGSITPVLDIYKDLLKINYVIGPSPKIKDRLLEGIAESDLPKEPFKVTMALKLLNSMNIAKDEVMAIGDSPADIPMFNIAGTAIAIRPKLDTANYAGYMVNDLHEAIAIMKQIE